MIISPLVCCVEPSDWFFALSGLEDKFSRKVIRLAIFASHELRQGAMHRLFRWLENHKGKDREMF